MIVLFLEAYIYEQTNRPEQAKVKCLEFLAFSTAKYSERFRGHRDVDINDGLFSKQRNISKRCIKTGIREFKPSFLTEFQPKYHYNSYLPGFNMNPEDISRYMPKSKGMFFLTITSDYSNKIGWDGQYY
tara:strand:+ start:5905 stop:6291 length:387 start_codon:yes stop_codon:yes gene_type:complete